MEELDKHAQGESPEPEVAPATVPEPESPAPEAPAEPQGLSDSVSPRQSSAPPPPEPEAAAPAEPNAPAPEAPVEPQELSDSASPRTPESEPMLSVDELMQQSQPAEEEPVVQAPQEDVQLKAVLEAIIYVAEEPLTSAQIAASLHEPEERIRGLLEQLIVEFEAAGHGVCIREIAGGFKMATKPEHHDAVRNFVKSLKPPLKLSLPALETLSVIAYKQPVTGPEIMEIRGVQGGGVLKTLLDRKLIAAAGRKNVIGKPILYKTTKEFLIQFGLKDLSELPSLKEFEEIRRMAFDGDAPMETPAAQPEAVAEVEAQAEPPAETVEAAATEPAAPPATAGDEPPAEPETAPDASQEV